MTTLSKGRAFLARLVGLGIGAGIVLLAMMAFLVILQVAARNFANVGLPWTDELARFSSIGLVFLGIPALAGRQVLVSVTILPDALDDRFRHWFVMFADLATLAFCLLLLWGFAEFLPRAGKFLTPAMRLPNYFYYSLALLGSVFLCLVAIGRIWDGLCGKDASQAYGPGGVMPDSTGDSE